MPIFSSLLISAVFYTSSTIDTWKKYESPYKLQYISHLIQRIDSLEKTLMLGETEGRRRRGDSRWDGWMASPTWWMWVWASSRSWWWTGKPGVLQSLGHKELDMTERRKWTELNWYRHIYGQLIYDRVSKEKRESLQ